MKNHVNVHEPAFDPSNIVIGDPVYIRKRFSYIGHAATTYSVEHALAIIEHIGQSNGSEFALPYAISLVENGEMVSIAEDNGEFSGGAILAECLKKKEGYNILVCVSRSVSGCFVTDMVQSQKHRAVKEAASRALAKLFDRLTSHLKTDYENESISQYINQIDLAATSKKPELAKMLVIENRVS